VALKRADFVRNRRNDLGTFSADTTRELNVFRHDRDALGVNGTQVRVLEQTDQVRFARLLKGHHGRALETQVRLEVLRNLADETLEGQLADEQLGALLVATNLAESDRAGPVTMRLLHATGGWSALASCLRRQLLSRSLSSGRFTGSLLRTRHLLLSISTNVVSYNSTNS
jgi:hypothetical protein